MAFAHLGILLPATIYYHLRPILSRRTLCTFVVFYLFNHTAFGMTSPYFPKNPKFSLYSFVVFPLCALVLCRISLIFKNFSSPGKNFACIFPISSV